MASSTNVIAAVTSSNLLYLLEERPMISSFSNGIIVTQKAAKELFIQLYHSSIETDENRVFMNENPLLDIESQKPTKDTKKSFSIAVKHFITLMDCSKVTF